MYNCSFPDNSGYCSAISDPCSEDEGSEEPYGYLGCCDGSLAGDYSSMVNDYEMDPQEMEAMLYSQIYHEQETTMDDDPRVESAGDQPVNVKEEVKANGEYCSPLATMVNFSGRSYMLKNKTVQKQERSKRSKAKVSDGMKTDALEIKTTKKPKKAKTERKVDKTVKKKAKKRAIVLTDSDIEVEISDGESTAQKGLRTAKRIMKKRLKRIVSELQLQTDNSGEDDDNMDGEEVLVLLDSSIDSDELDGDLDMIASSGDDLDINLNVRGLNKFKYDPVTSEKIDLTKICLETWKGKPPLTRNQVLSLLKPGKWDICDKDKFTSKRSSSRYYGRSNQLCRNCREMGHRKQNCPKSMKPLKCINCAGDGHAHWRCLKRPCANCNHAGHERRDCPLPPNSHHVQCRRCRYQGHGKLYCPETWRQYHLTTTQGKLTESAQQSIKDPYCFNCGQKGHFGYDCRQNRMNYRSYLMAPFVEKYTLQSGVKKMTWEEREHIIFTSPDEQYKQKSSREVNNPKTSNYYEPEKKKKKGSKETSSSQSKKKKSKKSQKEKSPGQTNSSYSNKSPKSKRQQKGKNSSKGTSSPQSSKKIEITEK